MPSYSHEALIDLLRGRTDLATNLLRRLDVEIPNYDEIRCDSANLSDLQPTEFRADLVLLLVRESDEVLGVVVEVQLTRDAEKSYSWPAYVANLRARHRCPVCLLVITTEESVARWATEPIESGPGNCYTPFVIGPCNGPVITNPEEAKRNVELAVLSAIEHGSDADAELAARIAIAAIEAGGGIAGESENKYLDMIMGSVSERVRALIEELNPKMNSGEYVYRSDYVLGHFGRVKAEGKAEGRLAVLIKLLTKRFGPLSDADQTRLSSAQEAQLDAIADTLLTAPTLEDALRPLS